jgi:signal transduction histidine kinase
VAHEINNPLTFVMANLDRLAMRLRRGDGELSPADRTRLAKAAEDALYGAERVREIVHDLSHLARPEQRLDSLVDVRRALESSLRMAGHEIRKRAQLIEQIGELPPVWGSTARLGQVFLNLLINAVHAVPEGAAEAHSISVHGRTDGERVVVEIADTGCGIEPAVVGRIFDPFFTTKDAGKGTGLGLSICHGIVTEHGGGIEVESTPGKGTRFRVVLPVARPTGAAVVIDPPAGRAHG